jgi:WD40 repeat protein
MRSIRYSILFAGWLLSFDSGLLAQDETKPKAPKVAPIPPLPKPPPPFPEWKDSATLSGHGSTVVVAFSPNGKLLATGSGGEIVAGGELKLWDVAKAKEMATLTGQTGMVRAVAFSPDGKTLAAASNDGIVRLWEVTTSTEHVLAMTPRGCLPLVRHLVTAQQSALIQHNAGVTSVAWGADGKILAFGDINGNVVLWDVATGKALRSFQVQQGAANVAFSPDGKLLAAGAYHGNKDSEVKVWEAATGKEIFSLPGQSGGILSVSFSPDGKTLATASGGFFAGDQPTYAEVKLCNVTTGQVKLSLVGKERMSVNSVALSRDGKILVTGHSGRVAQLWDADTGKELLHIDTPSGCTAAISPDGKLLATGENKSASLWDVAKILERRREK